MAVTPNLNLPLLDSEEKVSEDHLKINQFVEALDTRLGEFATTMAGLATAGHTHGMAKIDGLAEALELLAAKDHGHKLEDLSDVEVRNAPDGKVLQRAAGKWGLGERSYSITEINTLLAHHKHTLDHIEGLSEQLAKLADTTKDTKFNKGLSVWGDVYLKNNALITSDSEGDFADRSGTNIDHIWHDDANNAWNFNSDSPYKVRGNAKLSAGQLDLYTSSTSTNKALSLLKLQNDSAGQEDISADRFQEAVRIEQFVKAPANGSYDAGNRFYSSGLRSYTYNYDSIGDLHELMSVYGYARHLGQNNIRTAIGVMGRFVTYANSGGTVSYGYGGRSEVVLDGAHTERAIGQHVHVNPNNANASVDLPYGIYIHMNHDAGTVNQDPVALYQNYDGDWDGRKRVGIVQESVQENRLTGTTFLNGNEALHTGNFNQVATNAGVVTGVRLGSEGTKNFTNDTDSHTWYEAPSGCVVTGLRAMWDWSDDTIGGFRYRAVQKKVDGKWYTVSQE
ncbi:hypothetical protein [Pseudovibrio brasiliensis]|uniref:Tail fiber protein n=1 Tax=Pseudovibrio brasiliensis TaxID=1898042 RepID=A0ABX8B027_9HYPH|nr:hypothetical protein [Pseudovibrio brasiliensis]QUS59184.1 hypothetical protein KGB56_26930 [Pseudovibrio brasiliensis]